MTTTTGKSIVCVSRPTSSCYFDSGAPSGDLPTGNSLHLFWTVPSRPPLGLFFLLLTGLPLHEQAPGSGGLQPAQRLQHKRVRCGTSLPSQLLETADLAALQTTAL